MTPGEMQQRIEKIVPVVLHELDERGLRHHCIETAALLTKVIHESGMPNAYPLTVSVQILNGSLKTYLDTHGVPHDEATRSAAAAAGAPIILGKLAPEVPEGYWAGHLVVVVPGAYGEKHAMLDLTISQVNTPESGMLLQPLCLKVTEEFLCQSPVSFEVNKALLTYYAFPEDESYNENGMFMGQKGFDKAVSTVLDRLAF